MTAHRLSGIARSTRRNEACPCGSGRKFKHCCAGKSQAASPDTTLDQAEFRRGAALERQGRLQEAIFSYRVAATSLPEASSRLGHILVRLGQRQEAVAHFRAAAGLAGGASGAWIWSGRC